MRVIASQFADMGDLARYRRAKERGMTEGEALALGDNGIGCWGAVTAQNETSMCALPPDDMVERWGSIKAARGRTVTVRLGAVSIQCELADIMPPKSKITNHCGIDLNPAAVSRLGIQNGDNVWVEWHWSE